MPFVIGWPAHQPKYSIEQGQMDTLQSYYYTDSIFKMKHLLADDNIKKIIIDSWKYLVQTNKIIIYGFVIMPNHIHLIWNRKMVTGRYT